MLLITDTDEKRPRAISEMLYYMGILSRCADVRDLPHELTEECAAILISSSEALELASRELTASRTIPIYALGEGAAPGIRVCFTPETSTAMLASLIKDDMQNHSERCIGSYTLGAIDASSDRGGVAVGDREIPLTRTEAMILRYLILTYPRAVSAEEVLRYAFRSSRMPQASSVRTHISIMNKKLRSTLGEPLVYPSDRRGYLISEALIRGAEACKAT